MRHRLAAVSGKTETFREMEVFSSRDRPAFHQSWIITASLDESIGRDVGNA